ncbi:MAG: TetR/AcrR family transcriptional regulator [Dietzia sp.]
MNAPTRRTRANGEASRSKILDAATRIATERGYEGTSIALVSKQCGLPASSIYWHFTDKDDLIAAVIERSFGEWLEAWSPPGEGSVRDRVTAMARQVASALVRSPDFLRLGLMLALENRPVEPRARQMYLRVRADARSLLVSMFSELAPELSDADVETVTTYALAGADGLFIAREVDPGGVDFTALFDLHGQMIVEALQRLLPPGQQVETDR